MTHKVVSILSSNGFSHPNQLFSFLQPTLDLGRRRFSKSLRRPLHRVVIGVKHPVRLITGLSTNQCLRQDNKQSV